MNNYGMDVNISYNILNRYSRVILGDLLLECYSNFVQ